MLHFFNLFLVLLVLMNAVGIGLIAQRYLRLPFGLAQSTGVLLLCSVFFFVEHIVGLGSLPAWLMPITTVFSLWLILRERERLREEKGTLLWLVLGFGYVFAWRYALPNIDSNTERLPDLSFVVDYMQGVTLPPPDFWYPPHKLDHYYSFQHYGAALLGRWFQLEPGVAYNVGYPLTAGFATAAAYDTVALLARSAWKRHLLVATFLVGGTGASVFTPFMVKHENTYDSQRFVGGTTFYDDDRLTSFGLAVKRLHTKPGKTREQIPEMPMETFSYVVELGDFHAPLGGFWVEAVSLGALVLLLRDPRKREAAMLLGATIPLTASTNTWNLPFQGVMGVGAVLWLWWNRYEAVSRRRPAIEPVNWQAFAGGILVFAFLHYPFFNYFLVKNVGNKSPIEFIATSIQPKALLEGSTYFTPITYFLMVFWPILAIALFHFFGARGERRLHAFFWMLALAVTELFFVNDIYAGSAERFNTTLKWWPWVFDGVLLTLAASNLQSSGRIRRVGTTVVLILLLTYTYSLGSYYFGTIYNLRRMNLFDAGQLNGSAWLRNDPPVRTALEFLRIHPRGNMLESPDNLAFCQVGAFSLFAQQPTLMGWTSHESLWRAGLTDTFERHGKIKGFYTGELADPLTFLEAHQVRYILWLPRDNSNKEVLARRMGELSSKYYWNEFYRANDYAVGIWSLR